MLNLYQIEEDDSAERILSSSSSGVDEKLLGSGQWANGLGGFHSGFGDPEWTLKPFNLDAKGQAGIFLTSRASSEDSGWSFS